MRGQQKNLETHLQRIESCMQGQHFWFRDYPEYKSVRRKKSEIGRDGLRFHTAHQKSRPTNKDDCLYMESSVYKIFYCWKHTARGDIVQRILSGKVV